jgi:hypothetical protein
VCGTAPPADAPPRARCRPCPRSARRRGTRGRRGRRAVDGRHLVAGMQPRPLPRAGGVENHEAGPASPGRLPRVHAQIGPGRPLGVHRRRPPHLTGEAEDRQAAIHVERHVTVHVIGEEGLHPAPADGGDLPGDVVADEAPVSREVRQHRPHDVVHGPSSLGGVADHEVQHRRQQLPLQVRSGGVVPELILLRTVRRAADALRRQQVVARRAVVAAHEARQVIGAL